MKLSQDLKPVSYFKNNMAEVIRNLNKKQGTMIITQNGEAKAVLMDIKAYEDLQETVRRVILGGKVDADLAPLEIIEVISIDLADYSSIPESSKYLLKIGKEPESDINTDEIIQFVQNRQEKTGMDIDTILSIEKKAGNPMFKNVMSIEKGRKFLNEISIYFFVDYSLKDSKIEEKELDIKKEKK